MSAIVTITRVLLDDEGMTPQAKGDDLYTARQLSAFERGKWRFVGVIARATIQVPYGADFIVTTIDSPGLWGVESNSGEAYFREIFAEERATLLDMLESLRSFTVAP